MKQVTLIFGLLLLSIIGYSQIDNSKISPVLKDNTTTYDSKDMVIVFSGDVQKFIEENDLHLSKNHIDGLPFIVVTDPLNKVLNLSKRVDVINVDLYDDRVYPLNYEANNLSRSNYVRSLYGLDGSGVVVGIGDGGELGDHIDFGTRVINKARGTYTSFGQHPDQISGTVGGSGNIDYRNAGIAPNITLITQKVSLINFYANQYYDEHNMTITNNSYGSSFNCRYNGIYNYSSMTLDKQLRENPELLFVFAAGNSGHGTCSPYPPGYNTVLRYYQASKNVLTVGSANKDHTIWSRSSRGPTKDGRIKPEVVATGSGVTSTGRTYNYLSGTGTSVSCATTSGSLALLSQRYRGRNMEQNPSGALLKAVMCNSARDLGLDGPDFTYGFGLINNHRAVNVIDNQQYFEGTIIDSNADSYTVKVPYNCKRVKIMLYWADTEANPFPDKALINDLDLVVKYGESVFYPLVPSILPEEADHPAIEGVDSVNNIEQIVLDNVVGNLNVFVKGSYVESKSQDYVVTYDFIYDDVTLTFPTIHDKLDVNESYTIEWDADENNDCDFTLSYHLLSDADEWYVVDSMIPANYRQYDVIIPDRAGEIVEFKIEKNDRNVYDFTSAQLSNKITGLYYKPVCDGEGVELAWDDLPDVEKYVIYSYDGDVMVPVTSVADNGIFLKTDEILDLAEPWLAVSGVTINGIETNRTVAINTELDYEPCASLRQLSKLPDVNNIKHTLVYDITGRYIDRLTSTALENFFIEDISPGMYITITEYNDGSSVTQKLFVVK